jgi:integrase
VKQIKVFMEESYHLHHSDGHRHRKFTVIKEPIKSVYLSEDELMKIYTTEITPEIILAEYPKTPPHVLPAMITAIKDARTRFLIGAYTGLRFSDYGNMVNIDTSKDIMTIRQIKTDNYVTIPLHPIVKQIGQSLPKPISNQKLNKQLKVLCRIVGLKDKVQYISTVGGKRSNETYEKWKLITTHTARRSAATNMYLAGIDTISIMMITGPKTERAFMAYIGVSPEENAKRLKKHPFFN